MQYLVTQKVFYFDCGDRIIISSEYRALPLIHFLFLGEKFFFQSWVVSSCEYDDGIHLNIQHFGGSVCLFFGTLSCKLQHLDLLEFLDKAPQYRDPTQVCLNSPPSLGTWKFLQPVSWDSLEFTSFASHLSGIILPHYLRHVVSKPSFYILYLVFLVVLGGRVSQAPFIPSWLKMEVEVYCIWFSWMFWEGG